MFNSEQRRWAIMWRSRCRLDGDSRYLICAPESGTPLIFKTRHEARTYRDETFGYIKDRDDLKAEPHGWKLPQVVKVLVSVNVIQ